MPKIKYPIYIQYIVLIVSVAVMSLAVSYFVFAWTAPTKTPPGENVATPINEGSDDQIKTGGLSVGAFISQYGTILAKDSGSVGIGTSSPGARLDVNYPLNSKGFRITSPNYDADKLNAGLTFHSETNVNAQGDIVLYHNGAEDGSALDIWAYPSNSAGGCCHKLASFGVKSDGSEYQYFSGSVGIGTSSPDEKLDVKGVLEVGTGSRGAQFSSTVSDNFVLKTYTNTPNPNLWIGYGNGAGGQDNSREYIAMNGGKIMLMNGNVGIGTTTPSAKLQVRASGNNNPENNGLYVFNTDNAGGDDDAIITARVGGSSAGDPFISLDINGEYGWTVGVDNSDGNKFKIDRGWSDVGENTDFVIDVNGNVGIGTTSPTQKLDVAGYVKGQTGLCIGDDCRTSWPSGGGISGSGSANYIPKWTGAASLGDSVIYQSGSNVGIGTTGPTGKLHVRGGKVYVDSDNFGGTPTIDLAVGDTDTGLDSAGDGQLDLWSNNVKTISIRSGNVGIGTTTPSAKLQVRASGNNNPENNGLYVFNTDNAGGDDDAIITARVGGSSAGDPFISLDINGEYGWTVGVDNSDGNKFKIDRGWSDVGENTDFVINVNGNIGIGTTNPDEKLHIEGNVLLNAYAAGAGSGIFFRQGFSPGSAGDNRNVAIRLRGLDSPETPDGLEFDAYDGIVFNTQYNDRMVIKPNGNVGIGVTSPSQKLDVAGYVKGQTGLCIGNDCRTSWPAGSCYVDKSDCEQISEAKLRFPGCPARRPVLNRVDAVCGEGDCWDAPQDTFCCAIKCGEPPLEPCDWSGWKNMPPESYTCTPADCCPHGLPCWGDCPATGTITRRKYCDNTNPAVGGMVVKTEVVSINGCDCTGFCGSIGP